MSRFSKTCGSVTYARRKRLTLYRQPVSSIWHVAWGAGTIRLRQERHWVPEDIQ